MLTWWSRGERRREMATPPVATPPSRKGWADNFPRSYGTLCSDFKQSGLDLPAATEKSKNATADEKKLAAARSKGKGKAEEGKKVKRPKRKGLFAIDWFRIGACPRLST